MMSDNEVFSYPVPDGFPAMSVPVKTGNRLSKEMIKIEHCKPEDLVEWVLILYDAFPDLFWDMVEDVQNRPSLPLRTKAMAKHWLPWLTQPGFHAMKAVHAETGEIMGIAGWHECGPHSIYPTSYSAYPGVEFPPWWIPCAWRDDIMFPSTSSDGASSAKSPLGFTERMKWTADDIKEMSSFHSEGYAKEFLGYDIARRRELGDNQPHWYLAPFAVWPKWRGSGVGTALMRWGLDQADEMGWPAILEALPNARPVYYHFGFEPTASHGEGKGDQLVRPARGKTTNKAT